MNLFGSGKLITARDHFNRNIKLNRWLMTMVGVWPLSMCERKSEKLLIYVTRLINIFLMTFLVIPAALAVLLTTDINVLERFGIGAPLAFLVVTSANGYMLITSRDGIVSCLQHMEFDRQIIEKHLVPNEESILIRTSQFGRSLIVACCMVLYFGLSTYNLLRPSVSKMTEIFNNMTVRATTYPIYRPLYNPRDTPWFEIVQTLHGWGAVTLSANQITTNCFAATCVMHACGQLKIIMFRLECWVNENRDTSSDIELPKVDLTGQFADLVKQHLRVFDLISEVEALLNKTYFIGFIGYTLVICYVIYSVITGWSQQDNIKVITYITLLFTFSSSVFLPCYIGELLLEEFQNVSVATYMIDWYLLPSKEARYLILMSAASGSAPKLTAGKFMDMSLATFGGVMRTSLAYLNMLMTMSE